MVEALRDVTYDAVVVVPGFLGSALAERSSGEVLWGFPAILRYTKLWTLSRAYKRLGLTDAEREGDYTRVRPAGILKIPAFAPVFQGYEPYGRLSTTIRSSVANEDAVLEFAYDWRLPVEHNAGCLARAARDHLDRWRTHDVHRDDVAEREPRLVLVAHSMGGLLARALSRVEGTGDVPEVTSDIRATVTLGTPFLGAVKAAALIGSADVLSRTGSIAVQKRRFREVALTMPGIYDLLPMYRCVKKGESVQAIEAGDVASLGGDRELAEKAIAFHEPLLKESPPCHRPYVGTSQPTLSSLTIDSGTAEASNDYFAWKNDEFLTADGKLRPLTRGGDGTVPRDSAEPGGAEYHRVPQQHGALASSPEGVTYAADVLTERPFGPPLGVAAVGMELPDVVAAGERWEIALTGIDQPSEATCRIYEVGDAGIDSPVDTPVIERRDGGLVARVSVDTPGLFRVAVEAGATAPVTQLVLATDPAADG
ncbi:MAG: esterase/lipase family protein [Gaiellaceae bacterium]